MNYNEIYNEKFIASIKEQVKLVGDVKAVKFVREQAGLSLIQAKKLVDFCKQ